jgi:hypothetical protein
MFRNLLSVNICSEERFSRKFAKVQVVYKRDAAEQWVVADRFAPRSGRF